MPAYSFQLSSHLAGRAVSVVAAGSSTVVASGTLDASAKFAATLPVGDYVAAAGDGKYAYQAAGTVDQGDPDRLVDLSSAYAATDGLSFAPVAKATSNTLLGSNPSPVDTIGGVLYGVLGNALHRFNGSTWTAVTTVTGAATVSGLREAGDGEVLAGTYAGLYRSTGWGTGSVTWARTLDTLGGPMLPFTWDVDTASGWVTVTTYIGTGDMTNSRYAWLSKDRGKTFTQVYDINAVHPTMNPVYSHLHHAVLDPLWNATTPRIWLTYHKTDADPTSASDPIQMQVYSDNGGQTWSTFSAVGHHPVIGISTDRGMVFDTDSNPTALYVVPRTTDPTKMARELLYHIRRTGQSMTGWATKAMRGTTPGSVHVVFKSSVADYPGCIISTDGWRAAETVTIAPNAAGDNVNVTNAALAGGNIYVVLQQTPSEGNAYRVAVYPEPKRGAVPESGGNKGGLSGGLAGSLSTATGLGSASGDASVANGVSATAANSAVAIGQAASAPVDGVAIGTAAVASATYGTAIGRAATAVDGVTLGRSAKSGTGGIAIGNTADTLTAIDAVVVGGFAKANGDQSVAVGAIAQAALWSVAVGRGANAAASQSIAIGRAASVGSTHASGIALGYAVATTASSQLAIGGRHIEVAKVTAPANPAANTARWFVQDNGSGKMQLAVKFPTGAAVVIATEV